MSARDEPVVQATPERGELAETLQGELFERGQQVGEWPDDEKELHRDPDQWTDFTDRANKVRKLRFEKAADALLVAGWLKPRTVNSAAELKALPLGSVITWLDDDEREAAVIDWEPGDGRHTASAYWMGLESMISYPATVLFTPGDAG